MATPSSSPAPLTGDPFIDAATHGYKWTLDGTRTIKWSIANGFYGEYWLDPTTTASVLSNAFATFSAYANISFQYVGHFSNPISAANNGSDITISLDGTGLVFSNNNIWAIGLFPYSGYNAYYTGAPGDIYLNINSQANHLSSYAPGSAGFALAIHEIGHTLGLKHPHDDGGTGRPTFSQLGLTALDKDWFTVMSYADDYNWNLINWDPATPMVLDVIALQYLYGKNTTTNAGNTTYTLPITGMYSTIWDAGGVDTVDLTSSSQGWDVSLPDLQVSTLVDTKIGGASLLSEANLASPTTLYWLTGDIENVRGSAFADNLVGSSLGNLIDGGQGADTLEGGAGNDTYVVDNPGDQVIDTAGYDTIQASITWSISGSTIENLSLIGNLSANATGNELSNSLVGNSGSNRLDGAGGADAMAGGTGNDTYVIESPGDTVTEAADAGLDTVETVLSYTLPANVENLTLTGSASISGTGNSLNNVITGNSGSNQLDAGTGSDTLVGGLGDDIYIVDNTAADLIVELEGQGVDMVKVNINSGTYVLTSGLEIASLLGSASVSLVGNDSANLIFGNSGANRLDGGIGPDSLHGGAGNDTYVVDDSGDAPHESEGEGVDLVESSISIGLAFNIENLTLTGMAGISGTGNRQDNAITGNSAGNLLDGGIGNDTMVGGLGNDTYLVDSSGDVVTESSALAGEVDRVLASVNYTLGANLESLVLQGSSSLNGTGNTLANDLTGNAVGNRLEGLGGNDTLDGAGGADTLVGGAGDDVYVVDAGDTVIENLNEGTDRVLAGVSWTLGSNVEHLTLTGNAAIDGTGNALNNEILGNAGNNRLDGGAGIDTLIGGAGDDTYVVDAAGDVVTEGAAAGSDEVRSTLAYTLGGNLENLVLLGTDNLNGTGNALDNRLTGNAGNNLLDGGAGSDTMAGGAGNDSYVVDTAFETVLENSGEGTDKVSSSVTFALSANVEDLQLTGASAIDGIGNELDNRIVGNGAANTLQGGGGNDVLEGGAGADVLFGGSGDDSYVVDSAGDAVNESPGEGTDSVFSYVSTGLSPNVERLYLQGVLAIDGYGNELDNYLGGNSAANRLEGGAGADTLEGGAGNDTYVLGDEFDTVFETAFGGVDTIEAPHSLVLAANFENAVLTGAGDFSATGNGLANQLVGNSGANLLDGGSGDDTMIGGAGDDTYRVADAGDSIVEANGNGNDVVESSVSCILSNNVESLTLTGPGAIDGTGNGAANHIVGNGAANRLDGGRGQDTLEGGAGNDTYVVDSLADVLVEAADGGRDLVISSISYTLAPEFEDLQLTGSGNLNAMGNGADNRITGNSGANLLDGGLGHDTLAGGAGNDTYFTAGDDVLAEAANQGIDEVQSLQSYTLGDNFETLWLLGAAPIDGYGNALDNLLGGNEEANRLDGGAGRDILIGGGGDDTYVVDRVDDLVSELPGDGIDTIISSVGRQLDANVENLVLTGSGDFFGTGNDLANRIQGNGGNNSLNGGAGDDTLEGGGGSDLLAGGTGIDSLSGGAGDDTYQVDNLADIVEDSAGNDTVFASASFQIGAGIETLVLVGGDLSGTGNGSANLLVGTAGANRLDGGAGADTLVGGAGNDTYVIDQAGDVIVEAAYQGTDSVESAIGYALGSTLENLTLTGSADIDATGNGADNHITGNAGANRLTGGGGADTLEGGGGGDTYFVDANDVVTENPGDGYDTVRVFALPDQTYYLGSNLEAVILEGDLAGNAVGNAGNNRLVGTVESNVLVGLGGNDWLDGGGGIDILMGGQGNDTYVVDHAADRIKGETASGGVDVVFSSVSYILPNYVEELHLTGSANINATGNGQNNVLVGNSGRNLLTGLSGNDWLEGGAGADTLTGGLGNDSFVLNALDGQADRITDVVLGADQILFDTSVFTGIVPGALDASAFVAGAGLTSAQDASDRLIYNSATGALYYDADGNGGLAAVQVATLDAGLGLTPLTFLGY